MGYEENKTFKALCDALIAEYELTDDYQADQEHWFLLAGNIDLTNGRKAQIQVRIVPGNSDNRDRKFM